MAAVTGQDLLLPGVGIDLVLICRRLSANPRLGIAG